MNRRTTFVALGVMGLVVAVLWISGRRNAAPPRRPVAAMPRPAETHAPPGAAASRPTAAVAAGASAIDDRPTEQQRIRQRVALPQPVAAPWASGFLTNESALLPQNKAAAVEMLPEWIRKAIEAQRTDLAARYLATLIALASDPSAQIAIPATIAVYRLGDSDDFALSRMRSWIEQGRSDWHSEGGFGWSEGMDVRARVLSELSYYGDRRLDDVIYNTWLANLKQEADQLQRVDYAYYLESHGHPLPSEYWLDRLEIWQGARNTFEVLAKKAPADAAEAVKRFFESHRTAAPDSIYAERVDRAASYLFGQTGDAAYLTFLTDQVRTRNAAGRYDRNFAVALECLAGTNAPAGLALVQQVARNENAGLHDAAMEALGASTAHSAVELLIAEAVGQAQQNRFPVAALRAMLAQKRTESDAAYLQLRTDLLAGKFGWQATPRDFEALEFFRRTR